MENLFEANPESLPMTLRCFQQIAKERGWKEAKYIHSKESYIFATRPDGKKLQFCSCAVPATSYFSGVLADDKYAAYQLLRSINIPQPETIALSKENYQSEIKELLDKYGSIVIKPADGAHGNCVFTDLTTYEDAIAANDYVYVNNSSSIILAQQQLFSDKPEVRAICIGGKFITAFARIPAQVTGDGTHTVAELIDIENSTIRTAPYRSNLNYIDKGSAEDYIKKQGIADLVPKEGEKVQVVRVCNTGKGGTMIDITDTFPDEKRKEAEAIAEVTNLPVVGIDYFGDHCVEINSTPGLYHPVDGPASTVCVEEWVKYLETV